LRTFDAMDSGGGSKLKIGGRYAEAWAAQMDAHPSQA